MIIIKKLEKTIVILVLLLSIFSIYIMDFWESDNKNNFVTIKVDNQVVRQISFGNESNSSIVYDFKFNENNGYVEINNGKVRMLEMSRELCPKGICSFTGWIDKSYQSIVCLPNKIVVAIEGNPGYDIDDYVF